MYQPQKRHKHRPPCAGQYPHAPDGERADKGIGKDTPQRVPPFSAECGKQTNNCGQSKLKIQIRCEHGAQDTKQNEKQLRPWIEMQGTHFVIPAFSNCFFSILQSAKALTAAARTVPASMITSIQAVPVERMVSI